MIMTSAYRKPITILGAGAWGTALALYLSRQGNAVRIWSVDITEVAAMLAERTNKRFMPGFDFPDLISPTADLAEAIDGVDDILMVVPSVGYRSTLTSLKPIIGDHVRIISATKGLDANTGALLSDMVTEVLGKNRRFAVLAGPSFAKEVAAGLPTAVTIASSDANYAAEVCDRFNSDIFHTFPSDDVIGVEVGSVVKNVIAIATGIGDGMQYGTNFRCALITFGLAEMTRLGVALGAKADTFVGLSGMGDLILTCSDDQSRNRRFGLAVGKGGNIAEIEAGIGQVVEGKRNAELVAILATRHHVTMPLCSVVLDILQGKVSPKDGFKRLG
jgi:glycerol-3-phosphate dehydrogenase (NAD(P)+)